MNTRLLTATAVSPSPQDLIARCSDAEQVAIDLILDPSQCKEADQLLDRLVPDPKRQNYLRALVGQLKCLGIDLQTSPALDAAVLEWQKARTLAEARRREMLEEEQQLFRQECEHLAGLAPNVRSALLRRQRRSIKRAPRWEQTSLWQRYRAVSAAFSEAPFR